MPKLFKIIAFLEGGSLLLLLINMLLVKHNFPEAYQNILFPLGMTHGILFIVYITLAINLKIEQNWSLKKFGIVILAAFIPMGTFYVEKKYL